MKSLDKIAHCRRSFNIQSENHRYRDKLGTYNTYIYIYDGSPAWIGTGSSIKVTEFIYIYGYKYEKFKLVYIVSTLKRYTRFNKPIEDFII